MKLVRTPSSGLRAWLSEMNEIAKCFASLPSAICAIAIVAIGQLLGGCNTSDRAKELVPYLGQSVPGPTPELFAPGIVNTEAIEFNGVFSPDGLGFYFTRLVDGLGSDTMHEIVYADGKWGEPRELLLFPNKTRVESADMVLSADGQELFFLAEHINTITGPKANYDLWVSHRVNGNWSEAELVGPPISTAANELYPVLVADGSLYFTSDREGGLSQRLPDMFPSDLYRSPRLPDGSFGEPVNMGPPINSKYGTGDFSLAPDESYIVLSLRRPGNLGQGDLHVSFRNPDGTWGQPVSLGDKINSEYHEWCPMVTPDGKFLFFSRLIGENWETATGGNIYWVDISVIENLMP